MNRAKLAYPLITAAVVLTAAPILTASKAFAQLGAGAIAAVDEAVGSALAKTKEKSGGQAGGSSTFRTSGRKSALWPQISAE